MIKNMRKPVFLDSLHTLPPHTARPPPNVSLHSSAGLQGQRFTNHSCCHLRTATVCPAARPSQPSSNTSTPSSTPLDAPAVYPNAPPDAYTPDSSPQSNCAASYSDEESGTISEASDTSSGHNTSAADRLRQLLAVTSDRVSSYKPTETLIIAQDRVLSTYLPYAWQAALRKFLKNTFSGAQFSYVVSVASVLGASLVSGLVAYEAWYPAHDVVLWAFNAHPEYRTMQQLGFQAQYLGTVSFVTATLLGNTFGWTFSKQQMLVAQLSEEVFAIELLLQELFIEIPEPYLRWRVIKHIQVYIDKEMTTTANDSPFRADGAIGGILQALLSFKCDNNKSITKLVESVEMLARANSQRYGTAASLLPTIHWVLLTVLTCLVLVAFVLFDSDFEVSPPENRSIFAVVAAMLFTILLVLKDLSDPDNGLYSLSDALADRLSYVKWQMKNILSDPVMKVSMLSSKGAESDSTDEEEEAEAARQEAAREAAAVKKSIRRQGAKPLQHDEDDQQKSLPTLPKWLRRSLDQK